MNLTELARLCGCTTSTVSKAFRNSPHLRDETKQRILDTAREHGITISAEQLLRGRCVLVLLPTFNNEVTSRLLSNLQKKLMQLGLHMLAASWEYTPDSAKQILKLARTVNGLCGILCYSSIEPQHLEALQTLHVPIITIFQSHGIDCISYDILGGYRQAVQHLIEHGRRRIGFIGETMTTAKEFCYRQAMAECGMQPDNRLIFRSALYFSAAGAEGFSALFSLAEPPDDILCAYDYIKYGLTGELPKRYGNGYGGWCPYGGGYAAADGYFNVGVGSEKHWALFCEKVIVIFVLKYIISTFCNAI